MVAKRIASEDDNSRDFYYLFDYYFGPLIVTHFGGKMKDGFYAGTRILSTRNL